MQRHRTKGIHFPFFLKNAPAFAHSTLFAIKSRH